MTRSVTLPCGMTEEYDDERHVCLPDSETDPKRRSAPSPSSLAAAHRGARQR
jgi:hypothetical protein